MTSLVESSLDQGLHTCDKEKIKALRLLFTSRLFYHIILFFTWNKNREILIFRIKYYNLSAICHFQFFYVYYNNIFQKCQALFCRLKISRLLVYSPLIKDFTRLFYFFRRPFLISVKCTKQVVIAFNKSDPFRPGYPL